MRSETYDRFDVVVVQYPFLEGDQAKHRPALIVSSPDLHRAHALYWVMMITTAKAGLRPNDILLANHRAAGLPEPCVVRPSRLTTLSQTQIARRLGQIGAKDRNAVIAIVKRWMSF